MNFDDELPCGGYLNQDTQIKQQLENISLQKQKQSCQKQCGNCDCDCSKKCINKDIVEEKNKNRIAALCKKCKVAQSVLIQKNQPVCKECLFRNIEYKCRLLLQNTYKIQKTSNVLICFSGGLNSICLVNIMANIVKKYQKNKLFDKIKCIHIQQQSVIPQNFAHHFKAITDIDIQLIKIETILNRQDSTLVDLKHILKMFNKGANTVDLIQIFRDRLILEYAKQHQFDYILKGLNGESLATEMFKYFTKGIGGNIPGLSIIEDKGHFYYPLRQHLLKELQYYYYINKLSSLALKSEEDDLINYCSSGIDSQIKTFITNLQDLYSHTAPAIVRTAQKIQTNRKNNDICNWCFLKGTAAEKTICQRCYRINENKNQNFDESKVPKWMILE